VPAAALAALLSVSGTGGAGCHGAPASETAKPSTLSAEDAQLFEQGLDFIAKPAGLEGRWREDWDRELERRVRDADLVAVVSVRTLRTDTSPDRRVTHRIIAHVDRVIAGQAPNDDLELTSGEAAAGFASVDQAIAHLSDQPFVAYVKWSTGPAGEVEARFHLSPASDDVLRETEGCVTRVRPRQALAGGDQVIVRTR
jgi:hypothetical protein